MRCNLARAPTLRETPEPRTNVVDIETRIADLLRREPSRSMALDRLRGALLAERGTEAATSDALRTIVDRSSRFVLLEGADPLGELGCWPAGLRERYRVALREADPVAAPRVVLLPADDPEVGPRDGLELAHRSIAELWAVCRPGAELREGLTLAMAEAAALRRALRADG